MKLKVGDIAPDFTLFAFDGKELKKYRWRIIEGRRMLPWHSLSSPSPVDEPVK